jgi:hypothetical protein
MEGLLCQFWPLAAIFSLLFIIPCLFRCLQDRLGQLSGQTFHQMLLWPANNWLYLQMRSKGSHLPQSLGTSYIPAKAPSSFMMPPSKKKQLDQSEPILPRKGWNVRHPWDRQGVLGLWMKPGSLIYNHLQNFPACFPTCKTIGTSRFSTKYVCPPIPVPSGDHRLSGACCSLGGTPSLPAMWPPTKPTTHSSCASNKSLSTCGVLFVQQFLTVSMTGTCMRWPGHHNKALSRSSLT